MTNCKRTTARLITAAGVYVALSTAAVQDFCLLPHGIVAGTGGILTV
jgi:hypothetical protein